MSAKKKPVEGWTRWAIFLYEKPLLWSLQYGNSERSLRRHGLHFWNSGNKKFWLELLRTCLSIRRVRVVPSAGKRRKKRG